MTEGFVLKIDDPVGDDDVVFEPDEISTLNAPFEHTVANEWQLTTPFGSRARGLTLGEMDLYWRDDSGTEQLVYQGIFDTIEGEPDDGEQTLRGQDLTAKLKYGGASKQYQNIAIHEAIQDYWDSETDWDVDVVEPDVQTVDEDLTIVDLSTADAFEDFFGSIDDDVPLAYRDGSVDLLQAGWVFEAQNPDSSSNEVVISDDAFSAGEGVVVEDVTSRYTYQFETEYQIKIADLRVGVRGKRVEPLSSQILINGDFFRSIPVTEDLEWTHRRNDNSFGLRDDDILEPGTHTITFEVEIGSGELQLDVVSIHDMRYGGYNFDNEVHESAGYLDGPELYPTSILLSDLSDEASSTFNIEQATLSSDSDVPFLSLHFDGTNRFSSPNVFGTNTDLLSAELSIPTTTVQARFGLSVDDSTDPQDATPRQGYQGQSVSSLTLTVDTNDLPVVEDREFVGTHYENLVELHDRANYAFVPDFSDSNTLKAESFPVGQESGSAAWTALDGATLREDLRDYRNQITVIGSSDVDESELEETGTQTTTTGTLGTLDDDDDNDDDERLIVTVENDDEIDEFGVFSGLVFDSGIDTRAEGISEARSKLSQSVDERRPEGSVPIVPKFITPGKVYEVGELGGGEFVLEEVAFSWGLGESGELNFGTATTIEGIIGSLDRSVRRTRTVQ